MGLRMKRGKAVELSVLCVSLFIAGTLFLASPESAFAYPHPAGGIHPYLGTSWTLPEREYCNECHVGVFPSPSQRSGSTPCEVCHDGPTSAYTMYSTIKNIETHSSAVLGTKYGVWDAADNHTPTGLSSHPTVSPSCEGCHSMYNYYAMNRLVTGDWTGYSGKTYTGPAFYREGFITLNIDNIVIHDQDFADRATWTAKTGQAGRGLLVIVNSVQETLESPPYKSSRKILGYVVDSTASTIKVKMFNANYGEIFYDNGYRYFSLTYGQATAYGPASIYNYLYNTFNFDGPKTFAVNDGLGGDIDSDGNTDDSTPDGVCQVCHTQTNYWRSDGTLGIHYSGQRCTQCHEHSEGFKANCNGCHGNPPVIDTPAADNGLVVQPSPTGSLSSGAHNLHNNTYPFTCGNCHYNGMPATPIAGNDLIQIGFDVNGIDGTGTTYDGQILDTPYGYQGTNNTVITANSNLTCSNIYCHSDGSAVSTSLTSSNISPAWDDSTGVSCNSCHGSIDAAPFYTNGLPKANSHAAHSAYGCQSCHSGTTTDGTTIASTALHVNGAYDVANGPGVTFTATYFASGTTCDTISCHGNTSATWGDPSTASCLACHQAAADVDDYVYGNGIVAKLSAGEWGSTGHGRTTAALDCADCHDTSVPHDQATNPFRLANNSGLDGQNGVCLICHSETGSLYDPLAGIPTVSSTHFGSKHVANDSGSFCWDCHDPHGDSNIKMIHDTVASRNDGIIGIPDTNTNVDVSFSVAATGSDYAKSTAPFDGICQVCHTVTGHYTSTSGDGHNENIVCVSCHNHSGSGDLIAFEPNDCDGCHGNPPVVNTPQGTDGLVLYPQVTGSSSSGAHATHVSEAGYSCESCHYNGMPETDISGNNQIQIGFITPFSPVASGTEYDGQLLDAPYTYEGTNGTAITTGGSLTCTNIYCHSDGSPVATSFFDPLTYPGPENSTPAWNNPWTPFTDPDGTTCNNCHGYPPAYDQDNPKANSHFRHNQIGYTCQHCHYGTTEDNVTVDNTKHNNGVYDVNPAPTFFANGQNWLLSFNYTYDAGGGTCSSNSCHDYYGTLDPYRWGKHRLYASANSYNGDFCGEVEININVTGSYPSGSATPPYQCYYEWGDGTFQDWSEDCSASHFYPDGNPYTVTWSVRDANRHTTMTSTDYVGLNTKSVTPSWSGCTDPNTVDSDGDGMLDIWETTYGLDPFDPTDAGADLDGDGLTNLDEFILGTNPTLTDTDGDAVDDAHDGYPLDDQLSVCTDTIVHYENMVSYGLVTEAYNSGQIQTDNSIRLTASDHIEDLLFDQNIIFTLSGGYDCGFISNPVPTDIVGSLIISDGTVTVDQVAIR